MNQGLPWKFAPPRKDCPYCSSLNHRFTYDAHFREYIARYSECKTCKAIFQNPPLTRETLKAFYDSQLYWDTLKTNEYIYSGYINQEAAYINDGARRVRFIKRQLGIASLSGMSVLEIGAGAGFSAVPLQREGAHVTGIEPSSEMARFANEHYGLTIINSLFEETALEENSFDLVYTWGASMNFLEPRDIYQKAFNLLKPGGSLFFDFFDIAGFFGFLTARKRRKAINASSAPSKNGIRAILERSGFSNIRIVPFFPFLSFSFIASQLDILFLKRLAGLSALTNKGILIPVGGFYIVRGVK